MAERRPGRALLPVAATLGVAAAGVAAYATLVERNRFTLHQITVEALPAGARPLAILHISDLHLAPWQRGKIEWLRTLTFLEPDLVVSTGDLYGHVDALPALSEALTGLLAYPGVFVDGSNDHVGPRLKNPLRYLVGPSKADERIPASAIIDTARLHELLTHAGWADLNNAGAHITLKGTRLELVGTGDAHEGSDDLGSVAPNLAAQDDSSSGDPTVRIGVTHAPYRRVLDTLTDAGCELIFAGHTHGGQVCVPGFGAVVTNCDLPREQASGLSAWRSGEREALLHVSGGLGTSIYAPARLACPPSATLLTLVPRQSA